MSGDLPATPVLATTSTANRVQTDADGQENVLDNAGGRTPIAQTEVEEDAPHLEGPPEVQADEEQDATIRATTRRDFVRALYDGQIPVSELVEQLTQELAKQRGFPAGCLPLHVACDLGAPLAIVQRLLHLYPAAAHAGYFLQEQPAAAGLPVHEDPDLEHSPTGAGDLPVFLACSQPTPCLDTIRILIDTYPQCLKGSRDHVPLFHYCVRWGGSMLQDWMNLLEYVAQRSEEYLQVDIHQVRDYQGLLPIHHLAQGNGVGLMEQWINRMPQRVRDAQLGNNHLLHFAVQDDLYTGHYPEMLEYLVDRFPDDLARPNDEGELPLHLAQWPKDREILLWQYPYGLICTANDGQTPIDRLQTTMDDIEMVIRSESSLAAAEEAAAPNNDANATSARLDVESVILAETHEFRTEKQRLLAILHEQVIPPIRAAIGDVLKEWKSPEDVLEEILQYGVPHYAEEANM